MKIKTKKGAVILLMSSFAFLITVFLLANYQLKADFLGKKQAELLDAVSHGENALLYIDQIVKLSLAETWGSTHEGRMRQYVYSEECRQSIDKFNSCKHPDFENDFKTIFTKNLKTFNQLYNQDLKYEDFEITIEPYGADELEGLEITGKAKSKIILKKENIQYSLLPNFHLKRLSISELDVLK